MADDRLDVAKLDRIRKAAGISVALLAEKVIGVTRATYYTWVKKNSYRDNKTARLRIALIVLAMALRSGRLPIKDLKGAERLDAQMKVIKELVKKLKQQ